MQYLLLVLKLLQLTKLFHSDKGFMKKHFPATSVERLICGFAMGELHI